MTQLTFGDLDYGFKRKQTRREVFLAEMEQVVPWQSLLALIAAVYHKGGKGRCTRTRRFATSPSCRWWAACRTNEDSEHRRRARCRAQ